MRPTRNSVAEGGRIGNGVAKGCLRKGNGGRGVRGLLVGSTSAGAQRVADESGVVA